MDKTAKRALLRALRAVQLGDFITVEGLKRRVDGVCSYDDKEGDKWKNLVHYIGGPGGIAIVLEIERGILTDWFEDKDRRGKMKRHPRILEIDGEKGRPIEYRQKAKMTVRTNDSIEELDVVYSIYKMKDNIRYVLEDWGEGIYVYVSQGHLAPEEVQV